MNPTSLVSIPGLCALAAVMAAAGRMLAGAFYGRVSGVPVTLSATLWLGAVVCVVLALKVRRALATEGGIGLDRSQLNPLTVLQFMLVGKAAALTGAIVGGGYLGVAWYALPQRDILAAAASDTPGIIASIGGALALAAAGVWLERSCVLPPDAGAAPAAGTQPA